jgi:hypothetical protein
MSIARKIAHKGEAVKGGATKATRCRPLHHRGRQTRH